MTDEELFRQAVEDIEIDILNNEPLTLNETAILYASKRIAALEAQLLASAKFAYVQGRTNARIS